MSKQFPMEPHEYSGPLSYGDDLDNSPCLGGKLIIPWDYTSMMLGSDLGWRFDIPQGERPSRRCWRPFLRYFRDCRKRGETTERMVDRLSALETEVAELRALVGDALTAGRGEGRR